MLIVEDQEAMRKALVEFVRSRFPSYNVVAAADEDEALALCETHQPRIVLMDIKLGDRSGIDLAAKIKRSYARTAVIMVTNMVDPIYKELAEKAGACGYVIKSRLHIDLVPAITGAVALQAQTHEKGTGK